MARIIAYGDESGLDEKASYFLMGGFMGTPLDWCTTKSQWREALSRFGVPEFHSVDFFNPHENFFFLTASERDSLLDSLLRILGSGRVTPIGCAIHKNDFLELAKGERRILSGAQVKTRLRLRRHDATQLFGTRMKSWLEGPDAEKQVYRVGFNYYLNAVAYNSPPNSSVELSLDRHENLSSGARGYFEQRRKGRMYSGGQVLRCLEFVDSANEPAVQAADLYVHVASRQLNKHRMDSRRKRAWEALCDKSGPYVIDCQTLRKDLDLVVQPVRQFSADWGFPPDHEATF